MSRVSFAENQKLTWVFPKSDGGIHSLQSSFRLFEVLRVTCKLVESACAARDLRLEKRGDDCMIFKVERSILHVDSMSLLSRIVRKKGCVLISSKAED